MCTIHVRSIFELYVPTVAPADVLVVPFHQLNQFGFHLQGTDPTQSYSYIISLFSVDDIQQVSPACFSLAKRKIHYFQPSTSQPNTIDGIFIRFKISHGFFDFRKSGTGGRINVRLDVSCFNHAGELIQNGSSPIFILLPKRRKARNEDDEVSPCLPVIWENGGNIGVANTNIFLPPDQIQISSENESTDYSLPQPESHSSSNPPEQYYVKPNVVSLETVRASNETPESFSNATFGANNSIQLFNELIPRTSNDDQQYMVLYNGNAEVVGNFRALNFYKASDINIKEDIRKLIDDFDTRDALMRIDGVAYNFKRGVHTNVNKRFVGFIAQQVESVVPEAVQLIEGILHVDYEALLPYLNESIKKNYRDISNIKAENQRLQKSVDILYTEFVRREAVVKYEHDPSSMFSDNGMPKKHSNYNVTTKKNNEHHQRRPFWQWALLILASVMLFVGGSVTAAYLMNQRPVFGPSQDPTIPDDQPVHIVFNRTTDRLALIDLYMAAGGATWKNTTGWLNRTDFCEWSGIKCDTDKRVNALQFASFGLRGIIPESLGNLDHLDDLAFSNNSLHGTLPQSLFSMPILRQLDVSSNPNLSGTIPSEANLTRLVRLWVNNCNLTGTLPGWITLSKSLKDLYTHNNKFTGTIPPMPQLVRATFQSNQFEGSVPKYIGTVTNINLANNKLTGTLEGWRTFHANEVVLANNSLSGGITFSDTQLGIVAKFDISNNNFTSFRPDVIIPHLLVSCNASNNPFKCPIPRWLKSHCNATCT